MSAIHADLVGPLPEGRNSQSQRGFQYILSVIDSATRYLWLLPIRHKTAECVAATLFEEVISRVSVPSAILTAQGENLPVRLYSVYFKGWELHISGHQPTICRLTQSAKEYTFLCTTSLLN